MVPNGDVMSGLDLPHRRSESRAGARVLRHLDIPACSTWVRRPRSAGIGGLVSGAAPTAALPAAADLTWQRLRMPGDGGGDATIDVRSSRRRCGGPLDANCDKASGSGRERTSVPSGCACPRSRKRLNRHRLLATVASLDQTNSGQEPMPKRLTLPLARGLIG